MGIILAQACGHPIYWCFFLAYLFSPLVEVLVKLRYLAGWQLVLFYWYRCNFNRCIMVPGSTDLETTCLRSRQYSSGDPLD